MLPSLSRVSLVRLLLLLLLVHLVLIAVLPDLARAVHWDDSLKVALDLSACLIAILVIVLLRVAGYQWISGPTLLLAYAWLFHFGLVFVTIIDPGLWNFFPWFKDWSIEIAWREALLFCLLCFFGFASGCLLAAIVRDRKVAVSPAAWCNLPLFAAGVLCTVMGVPFLLKALFASGGLGLFQSGYHTVLHVFMPQAVKGITLTSIGVLMAAAGAPRRLFMWVIIAQIPLSLLFLAVGMRSFALPVPLILLLMAAKRGVQVNYWKAGAIILIFMFAIVFARSVRNTGKGMSAASTVGLSDLAPLAAVVEMGGTLQTVSLVFQWNEAGDPLRYGAGYWYALEKLFRTRDADADFRPDDLRSLDGQMAARTEGLGGSNIAESYNNFGLFGSLIVFLPIGYLLGMLDLRAKSPAATGILALVLLGLVWHTRGYFSQIPAYALYVLACWSLHYVRFRDPKPELSPET